MKVIKCIIRNCLGFVGDYILAPVMGLITGLGFIAIGKFVYWACEKAWIGGENDTFCK
jgi:hypothetical protein